MPAKKPECLELIGYWRSYRSKVTTVGIKLLSEIATAPMGPRNDKKKGGIIARSDVLIKAERRGNLN